MFHYISGTLAGAAPGTCVVDAGGVGFKLTVSQNTYEALPPRQTAQQPQAVKLYTYMAVREDGIELYGFISETELSSFKMLISVSGVGPKAAMSILSLLSPEKFALAVCTEDSKTISKASGIGPKTAARIILELKDKLLKQTDIAHEQNEIYSAQNTEIFSSKGKLSEAQDALIVLGYTRAEAISALKKIDTSSMEVEDIIKAALKQLMK